MARKTLGEKAEDLERITTAHEFQIKNLEDNFARVSEKLDDLIRAFHDLRREHESELKLLRHQVEDLKKSHERTGQRLWMILAPLVSAILASVGTYFLGIKK